jgi:predicted nuclease of predicted toxin-antitoxin system
VRLWLDAQLPPLLAGWINTQGWGIQSVAVRDLGLRDASDPVVFQAAGVAGAVVMTKDRDFIRLLDEQGPPPQVIWLRLGNCGNAALQDVLSTTLARAIDHLRVRRIQAGSSARGWLPITRSNRSTNQFGTGYNAVNPKLQ